MATLAHLLAANSSWAAQQTAQQLDFFSSLAAGQSPPYFWLGCADSRVPPSQLVGAAPGRLFVQRNVGNMLLDSDLNAHAALQYAVQQLRVQHIVIAGHDGCGAVAAALQEGALPPPPLGTWLANLRALAQQHRGQLAAAANTAERCRQLCKINVRAQVAKAAASQIVQGAWARGHSLAVHGLLYHLQTGLLQDLHCSRTGKHTN